jgi:presenilin-like A22 family membrane protease
MDGSITSVVVLTRIIYGARFAGLLGLLLTGLYCIDFTYKRYGVLLAVIFLVSFAMAAYIPVDRTKFLMQLTWKLGDEHGVWFVSLMIGVLALGTAAVAATAKKDGKFLWLAAGLAFLLLSRELLFFGANPALLAAGLAALAGGTVLCLRMVSGIYRPVAEQAGR